MVRGSLGRSIRTLAEHRWYAAYAAVPKDAADSGKTITGQIQFRLSKPPPRSYLVAIRQNGWRDINAFVDDLATALEATPTHIHGIAVLDPDWYVALDAYSTPRTGLKAEAGNSLLRFVNKLLPDIASMPMYQMSFDRYLTAAAPNQPLQRTRRKRRAAEG